MLRENIVSQVKELFQNASIESETTSHDGDPTGESMITYSRFYINDDSKYEDLQIGCTDWSENHKFANGNRFFYFKLFLSGISAIKSVKDLIYYSCDKTRL